MSLNDHKPPQRASTRDISISWVVALIGLLMALGSTIWEVAITGNRTGPVSAWVVFTGGIGLTVFVIGVLIDLDKQKHEATHVLEKVSDAVSQSAAAVSLADNEESDSTTAGQYQASVPLAKPAPPASTPATAAQAGLVEQIDILKTELRRRDRRGTRTQWFLFAAGIVFGILTQIFIK